MQIWGGGDGEERRVQLGGGGVTEPEEEKVSRRKMECHKKASGRLQTEQGPVDMVIGRFLLTSEVRLP